MNQVIIGGGMTGLIIATHMAIESQEGGDNHNVTLIAKKPMGTVVDGPMYLHATDKSREMLSVLGFNPDDMARKVSVGYVIQQENGSWDRADLSDIYIKEFRKLYYRYSRFVYGPSPIPENVMNMNKRTFTVWDVNWNQITERMLAIIRQAQNTTIIMDEMQRIEREGVITKLGSFIPTDSIISTIPRLVLEKALVDDPDYERHQIPDIDKSTKVLFHVYTDNSLMMDTFRDDFTYTIPRYSGSYDRLTRVTRIPGHANQFILEYTLPFVSDSSNPVFRQFMADRDKWHKARHIHRLKCTIMAVPRNATSASRSLYGVTCRGRYAEWDDRVKITDTLKDYPIMGY